jgi:hypothetical protein
MHMGLPAGDALRLRLRSPAALRGHGEAVLPLDPIGVFPPVLYGVVKEQARASKAATRAPRRRVRAPVRLLQFKQLVLGFGLVYRAEGALKHAQ